MKAIVVGSGAGGATAAKELANQGFEVTVFEAGQPFNPLSHKVSWISPLRGTWLLDDTETVERIFPHYQVTRTDKDLVIFTGLTEGGSTSISCGNMVRAENGTKEIGLDLSEEFSQIETKLNISPIPEEKWRPLTRQMFEKAEELGFSPKPTPKVRTAAECTGCGYCELGCVTGAKWDSRRIYADLLGSKIALHTGSRVEKVILQGGQAKGVLVSRGSSTEKVEADVVVLSAGGVGTAQILRASGLSPSDSLWVDVVLTVGGIKKEARMLNEAPMAWFAKKKDYILSPYFDLLSYWFHKPWRRVSGEDRVGMMIKLADTENGRVNADGTVVKSLTEVDKRRLAVGKEEALEIMEACGVEGPFVDGMVHGGHLGGTVPLSKQDVDTMHPSWLPENLWVADLSLMPRSQGMPTMLTAAALALRAAKRIAEENTVKKL